MRKLILALLVLLVFGSPAGAEICTLDGTDNVLWTAVATTVPASQWAGAPCTPTADDTFNIPVGTNVQLGADITVAQVNLTGGTLTIPPGNTLTVTTSFRVSGDSSVANVVGDVRWMGRIAARGTLTTGAGGTMIYAIPGNIVASISTTTDWLQVLDEDPAVGADVEGPIQVGPGAPVKGAFRWAGAKWRWYKITAAAFTGGRTELTLANDAFVNGGGAYGTEGNAAENQCTAANTPYDCCTAADAGACPAYAGTRGPGLVTATALASVIANTYGFGTELRLADAGNVRCETATTNIRGDLADQYVEFIDGACAGQLAKVAGCVDDAAGTDDGIYVDGDATVCGATPQIMIHPGIRAGDLVRIVRPATIAGNDTGWLAWTAGRLNFQRMRLSRLGFGASAALTPTVPMQFHFAIAAESATSKPDFLGSTVEDVDFAFMTMDTNDTVAMMFAGTSASQIDYRFNSAPLDLQWFTPRRIYIHDQVSNDDQNGTHGYYGLGVRNWSGAQVRIERLGDDSVGGQFFDAGDPALANNSDLESFVLWANIAATANSQQGYEPSTKASGTGDDNSLVRGRHLAKDFSIYGYASGSFTMGGAPTAEVDGGVDGGFSTNQGGLGANHAGFDSRPPVANVTNASAGCSSVAGVPDACCVSLGTGTCTFPALFQPYAPSVRNTYIRVPNKAASHLTGIGGYFRNSILDSGDALVSTLLGAQSVEGSLVDLGTAASSGTAIQGANTGDWRNPSVLAIRDSAMFARGGRSICSLENTSINLLVSRSLIGLLNSSLGSGALTNCDTAGNTEVVNIRDYVGTVAAAGISARGISLDGGGVASIVDSCSEADINPGDTDAFGTFATNRTLTGDDFGPGPGEPTTLTALTQPSARSCQPPMHLGLDRLPVSYSLMGDLVLSQLDRWSSKPLGEVVYGTPVR